MNEKVKEQFKRVQRWYELLKNIHTNMEYDQNSDYYQDVIYAFFQNCWHLKDWIINSKAIDPKTVYSFIDLNNDLKICRDLANGSKHLLITKPSVNSNMKINKHEYKISIAGNLKREMTYRIDGLPGVDIFTIATSCYYQWREFLISQGVSEEELIP